MIMPSGLIQKHCRPCEGGTPPISEGEARDMLSQLPGWQLEGSTISKMYQFSDYYQTIAFVNAVAWVADTQNHHPTLEVGYKTCAVKYTTHAAGGLTENDFICAAKIEALVQE